jgi:F0F1-type ATP synthase assembly protein I
MPEQPLDNINDEELNKWLNEWPDDAEDQPLAANDWPIAPTAAPPAVHEEKPQPEIFVPVPFEPDTPDETIRKSGLAYSIGVVLFTSIAFMLFLGWGADLLFGSKPWGIVGGIILGAIIGFVQVFRITSEIFESDKPETDIKPLFGRDDDE